MNTLRVRLLVSYMVIIAVTLCVVACALILLLTNRPPTAQEYLPLSEVARDTLLFFEGRPQQFEAYLEEIAAENKDLRIIWVMQDGVIEYDSFSELSSGDAIPESIRRNFGEGNPRGLYQGDTGQQWLYVIAEARVPGRVIFATARSAGDPGNAIKLFFNTDLFNPIWQAGCIGISIAILLAVLISTSVTRPLRRTAAATHAVAEGDYSQMVPEEGPKEVRDLAVSFNEMSRQVQRTQQTQHDFLANVSHELKTPLTSIQGYSQAILDGAASDPARAAQVIFDESARMTRLVEDLLDLARIESGQTPIQREWVDLGELLGGVVENLILRSEEKGVSLTYEISRLPRITGDNDRLAQVFTNLIDNAITHTPSGGTVHLKARISEGVLISITDTGKGIPAEDLDRIFERFYQVDKSRARSARKGTGLGLAITKEIIEAHEGTIRVESTTDKGATFHVWLPLPRQSDQTVLRSK